MVVSELIAMAVIRMKMNMCPKRVRALLHIDPIGMHMGCSSKSLPQEH